MAAIDPDAARFFREQKEALAAGVTAKGGAEAKRPPLPLYDGPPPETIEAADALIGEIGRTYSTLSDETAAAIIHLRGEADRPAGEEDHAAGIPDGEDLAEVSTAAAAPPDPEELEHDQAAEYQAEASAPAPKARPVPEPTGEGLPVPLWGDLTMKVYPEVKGACPVEFVKADRGRIYIDNPKSPPWLSTRIQDRLVAGLAAALGDEARPRDFMRRKVGEAFAAIAERLETDDGTKKALTPAAVRRVIEETERVTIYPAADGGIYEIVISGKVLVLTSAQMARKTPDGDAGFNHHWLILFPTDEIDATRNEWKAIKAHWYEIAEVREAETVTEAEAVIDRLVDDLEQVHLVTIAEHMTGPDAAWHDEKKGVVWVHPQRIAAFLEKLKLPGWNNGKLSTELQRAGYTFGKTRLQRIGAEAKKDGKQVRCWPFKPDLITFRPPPGESLEVSDLVRL